MATEIFINTDLKDLTANVVANKNRPTQVVRLPQIVEGETLDVELSLVNSNGGYDSRSGDSDVDLAVAVSAKGAAATSGTFTLTAGTETTAAIAYNASGQAVQDALNALNSNTGAYGSTVVVTKLAAGSYRVIFDTVGARTIFGGTSIDLAPESEVVAATSVVGSSTIRAQQVIEISQQPAIYTSTWTTHANKFNGQLDANTARVQEFIAAGLEAYFEVKVDNDVVCQVPIAVLPAVAAPNSLPAHTLPSDLCDFAADPSTNGCFSVTNWLADLLAPHTKAVWGYITGTLSDQTDLQSALDAKAPTASPTFTGTVTAPNITATTMLTANADAEFQDSVEFQGQVEFEDEVQFSNSIEAEDAVFNDQVECAAGLQVSSGQLDVTGGSDIEVSGGKIEVGDNGMSINEDSIDHSSQIAIKLASDERTLKDLNGATVLDFALKTAASFSQSDARLGIRKSNPGAALDVDGGTKISGDFQVGGQNFFASPTYGYVKSDFYGDGTFIGANNQAKTTTAFNADGKWVEKNFIKTIKITGSGFLNLRTTPRVLVSAAGAGKYIVPVAFNIFKSGASGEWGSGDDIAASIGVFDSESDFTTGFRKFGDIKATTAERTGSWMYSRSIATGTAVTTLGNRNVYLYGGTNSPTSIGNVPGNWYIRFEYMILDSTADFQSNVDLTINS